MILRFALALVLALSALSLDASAQRRSRGNYAYGGVTVYEHPDFRGDSVTFRNEVPDLREHGLNDRISSIEVDGNQAWEVCRDVNFGGRCRTLTGSIDDLREAGWNDRISSMRAVGYARNNGGWRNGPRNSGNLRNSGLVLYSQPDFRGSSRNVTSSIDLGSSGDRVRSVEVRGGEWELCEDGYRNARCVPLRQDVRDVRSLGLRNGVGSIREVGSRGSWW